MFRANSTLDDDTPEKFLKLTKKCLNLVEGPRWNTPYVYNGQLKYLMKKLKQAAESAQAYLILFYKGSPSPEDFVDCLEVFKLLYDLANAVKHFLRSCCQDAWLQAAVCLSDVAEHITSLGFNLEIMRLNFLKRLQLPLVDRAYEAEAHVVKEKAVTDRELLLKQVSALLETQKSTSPYYQLATCVYERLRLSVDMTPSQAGLPESCCVDATCLKQMEQVGKGSFATVHKASWLGMEVAKKTFLGRSSPEFEKEVFILLRLSHPSITSLIGYAQGHRECSIIMELMDEDLHTLIQRRMKENKGCGPPFGIHEAIDIMLQIVGGMRYLRERRIVHRDLKSMNILVKLLKAAGSRGHVLAKVSDFGLSKTKEKSLTFSNQTLNIGTTRWMAPELIKLRIAEEQSEVSKVDGEMAKYPYSCDVYSFAMVCYEILTGDVPYFEEDSLRAVKDKVSKGDRPKLPNLCHPRVRRLVERCWNVDPSKRPSFVEICVELRYLKCLFLVPSLPAVTIEAVKYDWSQISVITSNFTKRLIGEHFGAVYHGMLANGQEVAVTIAAVDFEDDHDQFINTIEALQNVRHRNLVSLVGYCDESRQMLLYEYMPLGTLHACLYGEQEKEFFLDWRARLDVALSSAEGLDYLHCCDPQILHCAVNSNNIQFNDKLKAKLSCSVDYGLFIDYFFELATSNDICGFGFVLLELICARPSFLQQILSGQIQLDEWARGLLQAGKIEDVVDPLLHGQYNMSSMQTVVELALLCMSSNCKDQPTMKTVVRVLRDAIRME